MIPGFEDQTQPLTDVEKKVVGKIIGELKMSSKEAPIANWELRQSLSHMYGINLSGARIRKIMHYIRTERLCPVIIASKNGYWRTNDPNEITTYLKSLKDRIQSQIHLFEATKRQAEGIELQLTINWEKK